MKKQIITVQRVRAWFFAPFAELYAIGRERGLREFRTVRDGLVIR